MLVYATIVWTACLLMLLHIARVRWRFTSLRGWLFVIGSVVTAGGLSTWLVPGHSGKVSVALATSLVAIPAIGESLLLRWTHRDHYGIAARFARLLAFFHPAEGSSDQHAALEALASAARGDSHRALQAVGRVTLPNTPVIRSAVPRIFRLLGRWEAAVHWYERIPEDSLHRHPELIMYYIRALGETGDLNRMVSELDRLGKHLEGPSLSFVRRASWLYAMAFCGRQEKVASLLRSGPLESIPASSQQLWKATAGLAAGERLAPGAVHGAQAGWQDADHTSAAWRLEALLHSHERLDRSTIDRRLHHPPAVAAIVLSEQSLGLLERLERTITQDVPHVAEVIRPAVTTYALIGVNLAMFGLALLLGGAENREVLYRLGALAPLEVGSGGGWRMIAALFLHYGPIHLTMNMFALHGLGRFIEPLVGRRKFLAIYLLAGLGSMIGVTLLTLWGFRPPRMLVGASGAIMGLMGASLAFVVKDWFAQRDAHARRQLRTVLFLFIFQSAMDLNMPQISFSAHMGGALVGLSMFVLLTRRSSSSSSQPQSQPHSAAA